MGRGLHELPLFPSEDQIAALVVGPERAKDWPAIAAVLEKRAFPKIDPLYGGRSLAKVLAWFKQDDAIPQGVLPAGPARFTIVEGEDGREEFGAQAKQSHGRRPADRARRAGP
jgi:hypothetical protein